MNKKFDKIIFFDFDGTLIDVSERHYSVYKEVVQNCGPDKLASKKEYWEMRRYGMSFMGVLKEFHNLFLNDNLKEKYYSLIEARSFLVLDRLLNGTDETIKLLRGSRLVLVTLRKNLKNLIWQLRYLNVGSKFDEILCSPVHNSSIDTKRKLIERSIFFNKGIMYVVGDTEVDLQAGKEAGCITIAVTCGMRNREYLENNKPDYIIGEVSELPALALFNKFQ